MSVIEKLKRLFNSSPITETYEVGEVINIKHGVQEAMIPNGVDALKSVITKEFGADSVHLDDTLLKGHIRVGKDFIDFEVYPEDIKQGADQFLAEVADGVHTLSPGSLNILLTKIN